MSALVSIDRGRPELVSRRAPEASRPRRGRQTCCYRVHSSASSFEAVLKGNVPGAAPWVEIRPTVGVEVEDAGTITSLRAARQQSDFLEARVPTTKAAMTTTPKRTTPTARPPVITKIPTPKPYMNKVSGTTPKRNRRLNPKSMTTKTRPMRCHKEKYAMTSLSNRSMGVSSVPK